uniref:Uncharacterized protein n=1 Tax=Octopus bimaculoides TaxID=37653 RepID=A0A0L8IEG6_OCTBM
MCVSVYMCVSVFFNICACLEICLAMSGNVAVFPLSMMSWFCAIEDIVKQYLNNIFI